ncbi:DUF192 domain-containing protein [Muricauda sp. JGD-17]|uniref:DUF192 domain-containing protein n=1 Tax=Flagellimonas ochracea TaxID=2696472 RepID=A0A964WYQ2_9FLAO|nr:DUF192 domain-containing protein [Allomuricauda ochracea]NAY93053.1 DUF192 domain-containing protein [Allomuricauda ochracea]
MKRLMTLFVFLFVLMLASCKTENKKEIKTETISFTKEGDLTIFQSETDSIITKFDIEVAESEYETQTGLMYRQSMDQNQAMLFIFPDVEVHSFYMKNTEFPLDIIYIDENLRIASFQKNAQPFDETGLSSQVPVKYVLEINAGLSDSIGLQVGDSIAFTKK